MGSTAYDLSGLRILLIEHNDFMRRAMVGILRTLKIPHVAGAGSEDEGWVKFRDESFDLLICDWSPGLDGIGFLDRVRRASDSPDPFVTVMLLSAFAEFEHVTAARDHGANGFIAKPVAPQTIYRRIVRAIEREPQFVRTGSYFGPDRRHKPAEWPGAQERRSDARTAA